MPNTERFLPVPAFRPLCIVLAALSSLSLAACGGGGSAAPAAVGGTPSAFAVGGSVSGLPAGTSVVLQDNGADNLAVSSNAVFTFPTAVANNASYSVTVATQPAGANCAVTSGAGTINAAPVGNVAVGCASTATTASTAFSVLSVGTARIALVPMDLNVYASSHPTGITPVAVDGATRFAGTAALVATSFPINACSTDSINLVAVCINNTGTSVAVLDLSKFAASLNIADIGESEPGTGAPTSTTSFTAGPCTICGVVVVPSIKSFVVSAFDGYRVYGYPAAGAASPLTPAATYAIPISENFSVSSAQGLLLSADYAPTTTGTRALRLVKLATGKAYAWTQSTDVCAPADSSACAPFISDNVDSVTLADDTGIATLIDEYGDAQLSVDLGQAVFDDTSQTFTAPHSYNQGGNPYAVTQTAIAGILASSRGHWGLTVGEFGDAYVGVQPLPAAGGSGGTLTVADPNPIFLDLSTLANHAPCTAAPVGGLDPHTLAYTVSAAGKPLGLVVSNDSSCIAVVDPALLYAAPRQAGANSNLVDTTLYDPVTAGAVTFFTVP